MNRADRILSASLSDLRTRLHVEPNDMQPEEIRALVLACEREANPYRGVNADAAGIPVRVCEGVYFWRLTVGAAIWLDEHAERCLGTSDRYRLALVYAHLNARDPEAFDGLDTERAINRAVSRALRRIPATAEEIDAALEIALGLHPDTREHAALDVEDAATSWARIVVRLETQTGIPAREWIWDRSNAYCMKSYVDLSEFAAAYAGRNSAARAKMKDELDQAVEARQRIKVRIAEAVKARKEQSAHG